MSSLKFYALVAMTLSTPAPSFLSYADSTTNSYYDRQFISNITSDVESDFFNLPLYDRYPTNSSFQSCMNSITTTYTSYEVGNVANERRENFEILDSFKSLEDDWDECGAIAPKNELIELAKGLIGQLCLQPEIFPTPDGGVQLEYAIGQNQHLNIEVISEKKINIFEMYSDRTYKEECAEFDIEYIKRRINKFYDCI